MSTSHSLLQVIDILKEGDENETSKKEAVVRASEIRDAASPALCRYLTDNLAEVLASNPATLLVACVLKKARREDAEPLLDRLAQEASKPFCPGEDDNLVERPATHLMIKKLIQHDTVKREHDPEARLFSSLLLEHLDEEGVESWVTCNRGAFLFVLMLETGLDDVAQHVKEKLKCITKTLRRQKTKGAEVLRSKLKS